MPPVPAPALPELGQLPPEVAREASGGFAGDLIHQLPTALEVNNLRIFQ